MREAQDVVLAVDVLDKGVRDDIIEERGEDGALGDSFCAFDFVRVARDKEDPDVVLHPEC